MFRILAAYRGSEFRLGAENIHYPESYKPCDPIGSFKK
jgi:hypothetical protein